MNIDTTKIKTIQNLIDTLSTLPNKSNPITLNVKGSIKNGVLNMQNTTNLNVKITNKPGLNMIVTLWGDYDNDYIRKIIKHNIEILQPQTVTFWNLDDLIEYSKKVDNKQMFIAMENKVYTQIAEAARLSILLEQPNTIYVDADMIINDSICNLISNSDKDIISGWINSDNDVSACSGTFLYHGFTDGKALREYYSYFNSDKYDPQYNDIFIFDQVSKGKVIKIYDNLNFIGQWDDLFITSNILGLHTNISILYKIRNKNYKGINIGYISESILSNGNHKFQRYYDGIVFVLYEVEQTDYNRRLIDYNPFFENTCFLKPLPYVKEFKQDLINFLKDLFPNIIDYDTI